LVFNLIAYGKISKNATDQEIKQAAAEIMQKVDSSNFGFANARVDGDSGLVKYCSVDVTSVNVWTNATSILVPGIIGPRNGL
jgi:hypothetical protein